METNSGIQPGQFYSSSVQVASGIQQSFTRQELAFEYYDSLAWHQRHNCKVYSFESLHTGKRMFLVAEYFSFCNDYFVTGEYRHVYEIIREGCPCRVYFDLEFSVPENTESNGDLLSVKFVDLVVKKLYEVHPSISSHNVIVLDSCTAEKYSKHIILQLFGASKDQTDSRELLMPHNLEVGHLLNLVLLDITTAFEDSSATSAVFSSSTVDDSATESNSAPPDSSIPSSAPLVVLDVMGRRRVPKAEHLDLFVRSKDSQRRACFVDLGVYTRNRAFRLLYSCKFGKTRRLELSVTDIERFGTRFPPPGRGLSLSALRRERLTLSLVVPYDLFNGTPASSTSGAGSAEETSGDEKRGRIESAGDSTSCLDVCSAANGQLESYVYTRKYEVLPCLGPASSKIVQVRSGPNASRSWSAAASVSAWSSSEVARSASPREPSWFPRLDEYVAAECASVGGIRGVLTSWSLTASTLSASDDQIGSGGGGGGFTLYKLKYQVLHNRWCGNIGRAHRSNGIMLEVDLVQGTVTQTCWDAECRGYRAPPHYLPAQLVPEVEVLQSMVLDYQIERAIRQNPAEWQAVL